jgi:hypothetical protein
LFFTSNAPMFATTFLAPLGEASISLPFSLLPGAGSVIPGGAAVS